MTNRSDALLEKIYENGCAHDEVTSDTSRQMLNITPSTGCFLDLLVTETKSKRVLELGTSNGYTTIWLGRAAARFGGKVMSVEYLPSKVALAAKNVSDAELSGTVELRMLNIGKFLKSTADKSFDFVFLDADHNHYVRWWQEIRRVLDFGMLVVNNATSHDTQLQPFIDSLQSDDKFEHQVFDIGKGQLVVRRTGDPLSDELRTLTLECRL